jgi:phosphomannomutase
MTDISSFAAGSASRDAGSGESLKFGTSGLRGLVTDLVGLPSRAYALAFIRHMRASGGELEEVLIGRDLRSSSPQIAADCAAACRAAQISVVDCGELPTPALALEAIRRGAAAIMVTGSHIPDDRNGLKFYRPDGEITKEDEAGIVGEHAGLGDLRDLETIVADMPAPIGTPLTSYLERYVAFFGTDALKGMRVGVYQHSSVARDVLVDVLTALGAEASSFGHSPSFIPVDTEAHSPEQVAMIAAAAQEGRYSAIVSTDGDADRPLVADENGRIVRGDVLGLIAAAFLKADSIVTPVTSGSVIERSAAASRVLRTRVGSPFVIRGMSEAAANGGLVLGFEANGGVLLGGDAVRAGRTLSSLPTRDAFLPILATLSMAAERGSGVGQMIDDLDVGFAVADRLKEVSSSKSEPFLSRLAADIAFQNAFFAEVGPVVALNPLDGLRFEFSDGSTLHYRASGNAPELRCYVEAGRKEHADRLLAWGLRAAGMQLQTA